MNFRQKKYDLYTLLTQIMRIKRDLFFIISGETSGFERFLHIFWCWKASEDHYTPLHEGRGEGPRQIQRWHRAPGSPCKLLPRKAGQQGRTSIEKKTFTKHILERRGGGGWPPSPLLPVLKTWPMYIYIIFSRKTILFIIIRKSE